MTRTTSQPDLIGKRVHHGDIQTAIHTHVHRQSGRTITVIGTTHIAEPDYYAELRKTIRQLEADGAVVQHERLNSEAARAGVTDAERPVLEEEINRSPAAVESFRKLGFDWVFQTDEMPWAEHWQPVDVDSVDAIRMLGTTPETPGRIQSRLKQQAAKQDSEEPPSPQALKIMRWVTMVAKRRAVKGRRPVGVSKQRW